MAINRYRSTEIVRDEDNKRAYKSTIFPNIKPADNDVVFYTRWGDRLDLIAYKFYGDSTLWWIIAEANGLVNGSLWIATGTRLKIPMDIVLILNQLDILQISR